MTATPSLAINTDRDDQKLHGQHPAAIQEESQNQKQKQKGIREATLLKSIAFPGALGGLAKTTMDLTMPESIAVQVENSPMAALPLLQEQPLMLIAPANMFLGMVSALIGTLVLSDLLDFSKSARKVFGVSLIFGLSFSLVFESATSKLSLERKLGQAETEKNLTEEIAIQAAARDAVLPSNKQQRMRDIRLIAEYSSSPRVQENAFHSMQQIAGQVQDIPTLTVAIKCFERLAKASLNSQIQSDSILAIERIAVNSNQSLLRKEAVASLSTMAPAVNADNQETLQRAIDFIQNTTS